MQVPRFPGDFFLNGVLWTDELIVGSDGSFNVHNEHHYAEENPHCLTIGHIQGRWTICVWTGIIHHQIIGPYFFEQNVNGETYSAFLQNSLDDLLANVPLAVRQDMWFQQDGHPAHTSRLARAVLNEKYPNRWIGLRGPLQEWSPRSPDLAECDFYLWGMLKGKIFPPRPQNPEELKQKIRDAFASIEPIELERVHQNLRRRIGFCIRENGGHFEHLDE